MEDMIIVVVGNCPRTNHYKLKFLVYITCLWAIIDTSVTVVSGLAVIPSEPRSRSSNLYPPNTGPDRAI